MVQPSSTGRVWQTLSASTPQRPTSFAAPSAISVNTPQRPASYAAPAPARSAASPPRATPPASLAAPSFGTSGGLADAAAPKKDFHDHMNLLEQKLKGAQGLKLKPTPPRAATSSAPENPGMTLGLKSWKESLGNSQAQTGKPVLLGLPGDIAATSDETGRNT